jgi:hypothetical protein
VKHQFAASGSTSSASKKETVAGLAEPAEILARIVVHRRRQVDHVA